MNKGAFSLEDLVEGPMYEEPIADGAPVDVPVENVDESDMIDTIVETADENATVESAVLFISHSIEHYSVLAGIAARSQEASVEVNHKFDIGAGLKKVWDAIVEAFRRLVENITKFFTKISNFVRSGGIKEKIAYVQKNIGAIDFKKIDGNKQVVNPEFVTEVLAIKGFKVPTNITGQVADAIFGVDPSKIRAKVVGNESKTVRLADAVPKAKGVITDANLQFFQTTVGNILKDAKMAQKQVLETAKANAGDAADKKKAAAGNARVILKKISDASYLSVRGFSWFITVTNYTYGAIKGTESKSGK